MDFIIDYPVRNGSTLINLSDLDLISQFEGWHINANGYVSRYVIGGNVMLMHRLILGIHGLGRSVFGDHINHITNDNTRGNLRIATQKQNCRNITPRGRSKYLGVSYQTCNNKYEYIKAKIRVDGKLLHIGTFKNEEDAALAYNEAAKIHFGEFANLNKI